MKKMRDAPAAAAPGRNGALVLALAALTVAVPLARAGDLSPEEIVRRSVANNTAGWDVFPTYTLLERSVLIQHGHKTDMTYRVLMIDGSPYNRIVEKNNEPVPEKEQEQKLEGEIARRKQESPGARQNRIERYQRGRRQDHELMAEMLNAFDYKLTGEETVGGRRCYVLEATARPGYQPRNRDTKVLTGMRGTMWVDKNQFQWVRVQAEVFRPVAFGLFIAKVHPGTEFKLEMGPVNSTLWAPQCFEVHVKASILFWNRESLDQEYYSDYRPGSAEAVSSAALR